VKNASDFSNPVASLPSDSLLLLLLFCHLCRLWGSVEIRVGLSIDTVEPDTWMGGETTKVFGWLTELDGKERVSRCCGHSIILRKEEQQ
jgi:hypothetical protein